MMISNIAPIKLKSWKRFQKNGIRKEIPQHLPPGTVIPGTVIPGTVIPGTGIPGTVIPGTVIPGTVIPGTGIQGALILMNRRLSYSISSLIGVIETGGIVMQDIC